MGNELDALSEALRRRREVRIINKYAVVAAYVGIALKSVGALMLLWATVVLLGGFVSSLKKIDFWYLTIISFLQAAGVFDAWGGARLDVLWNWVSSVTGSSGKRHRHGDTQLPIRQRLKRSIQILVSKIIDITPIVLCTPVVIFALLGPHVRILLSGLRVQKQDYGINDSEATKANMKRALNLFYHVTYAHGYVCILWMTIQWSADMVLELTLGQHVGQQVIRAYLHKTKEMCANNPASIQNWNLITYGVGLLDSSLAEDYVAGGRVLNMLIKHDKLSQITRVLIRSPRQRIQKLIGTLAWRSPDEQEMIWLAARVVEHLADHLNLAHFPGALECISSLFNQLPVVAGKETKNLVVPGLRILKNLAHDEDNCRVIYNSKGLLSKIVAPLRSDELVQDIKSSTAWTKVVHWSLRVVTQLMITCAGATGKEMRGLIADDSHAVRNLEAILDIDVKSDSRITELQMGAVKALTQLAMHHPASTSAEKLIERALYIFVSTDWMEDYLKHSENRTEEGKETASLLKENAGEALELLSSHPEAIKSFTVCEDDVHRLTELIDCNINTIECKISAMDTVEIEISTKCRISAAVILKHLSNYVKAPTLRKALRQLLPIQQAKPSTLRSHINNRTLQATLLSLVMTICENNNINLAGILLSQTPPDTLEEFVVRLKKIVEDNMYGTSACLAIQKLTCKMVTEFMKHDRNVQVIEKHHIIGTLLEASKAMAKVESSMFFTGINCYDRHGVLLKPLSSVLSKNTEDLLSQRKQALGIHTVAASVPVPLP